MAPKPPDRKRKRGRPPGASKSLEDASSREQPEINKQDAEDESRPKKRGRKAVHDNGAPVASPDERDNNAPQSRKPGRPAKGKAQTPDALVGGAAEVSRKIARPAENRANMSEARANGNPPSSEARRSGRQRRAFNPNELYGARPPSLSPTQFSSPPSDSARMPPPPRRNKKSEPAQTPDSTPRRSERERRGWNAEKLFSSCDKTGLLEKEPMSDAPRAKAQKRANLPSQEQATAKTRKQKTATQTCATEEAKPPDDVSRARERDTTVQNSPAKKKHRPRAPQQKSPGEGPSRPRKRKDVRATDTDASTANTTQPRNKTRRRKAATDGSSDVPEASEVVASKPSGSRGPRGRRPTAKVTGEHAPKAGPAKFKDKPPQRPLSSPESEQDAGTRSEEDDEEMPYRYLKETIRNIPRSTITDKWTPLDPPAIHAVSSFFADVQRPVLLRLQNTKQQRGYASVALGSITRRIRSRLVKGYPFPAPTTTTSTRANAASYEDDFDFERTVYAKQTLENTLNLLLHSVSLLEREIHKEENALARDYDQLHTLEANAKSAAYEWRNKTKREHVLAPGIRKKGERDAEARDRMELVPAVEDGLRGGLFKDLEDEDLITLSQQIGSHMKSMKDNLQQIDGVIPAITQSKGALQQVLLKQLDDEQYERVLLG